MMVIVARGDEGGLCAVARDQREAEHAAIERERPFDIGDFQMDMADAGLRIDRRLKISAPGASAGLVVSAGMVFPLVREAQD